MGFGVRVRPKQAAVGVRVRFRVSGRKERVCPNRVRVRVRP